VQARNAPPTGAGASLAPFAAAALRPAAATALTAPAPTAAGAAAGARPWLVGPWVDLGVVFGLGGVLSAALYTCYRAGSGFLVIAAFFAVLADFPHVLQTSVRVWLDPAERQRLRGHYLASLAVTAAAVGALTASGHFSAVLAVYVAWQVYHVVKQHIGIVSVYAAKAGYRGSRGPAKRLLIFGCLAPVLYRAAKGLVLGHYVLNGRPLPFSGMTVPLPPIPGWLVWAAYLLFALALGEFTAQQVRSRLAGRTRAGQPPRQGTARGLPGTALLTIAVTLVFYNASYRLVADPYALILIATTFHSLQYHVISWARIRGRFTRNPGPRERRLLLARLSRPGAIGFLLGPLILAGALLSAGEFTLAGAIPFTVVLHHFYLDGVMWKPKTNPGLAADLALRPA
jgi:hypothetical protein